MKKEQKFGTNDTPERKSERIYFLLTILLLLMVALSFLGCANIEKKDKISNGVVDITRGHIQVVTVDECEYVIWDWCDAGSVIHKQNCKFCEERKTSKIE